MLASNGRVYGNLAQPNHLASLLVTALAALVYLDRQRLLRGVWLYCTALLIAFTVAATESRTGALSITVLFLAVAMSRSSARASLRWLIPSLALFWLSYVFWQPISSWVGASATRTGVGLDSAGRFELWIQLAAAVAQKPWGGWGWLNLGAAQQAVAIHLVGTTNMHHAHNLFLDFIVWFGAPVGGLLTVAVLGWTWQVVRLVLRPPISSTQDTAFYYALLLLPIAVHSMLEYPLAYLYFFLIFAFFAGAVEASLGYTYTLKPPAQYLSYLLSVTALGCATWMAVEYSRIEADFRALRLEQTFVTPPQELHVYSPPPTLLTQYGTLLRALQVKPTLFSNTVTLDEVHHASQRFPWFLTMQHYYLVLLRNGQCDKASRQRQLIASFFGLPGIAQIEDLVRQYRLNYHCQLMTGMEHQ